MPDLLLSTVFVILEPDGAVADTCEMLPEAPTRDAVRAIVEPMIGGPCGHLSVSGPDAQDMFVAEASDGLTLNETATRLYRAAHLILNPQADPETLPAIYGTAVLCGRRVWR